MSLSKDTKAIGQITIDQLMVLKSAKDEKVMYKVVIELTKKGLYLGPNYKLSWKDVDRKSLDEQMIRIKQASEGYHRHFEILLKSTDLSKPKFHLVAIGPQSIQSLERFVCHAYDRYRLWAEKAVDDEDAPFTAEHGKVGPLNAKSTHVRGGSLNKPSIDTLKANSQTNKRQRPVYGRPRSKLEKLKQKILTRSYYQGDDDDIYTQPDHTIEETHLDQEALMDTDAVEPAQRKARLRRKQTRIDEDEDDPVDFGSTTFLPTKRIFSVSDDEDDSAIQPQPTALEAESHKDGHSLSQKTTLVTPMPLSKTNPDTKEGERSKGVGPTIDNKAPLDSKIARTTITTFFSTKPVNPRTTPADNVPIRHERYHYSSPLRSPHCESTKLRLEQKSPMPADTSCVELESEARSIVARPKSQSPSYTDILESVKKRNHYSSPLRSPHCESTKLRSEQISPYTSMTPKRAPKTLIENKFTSEKIKGAESESEARPFNYNDILESARKHTNFQAVTSNQYIGLKNLGNTCYFNAGLQMLFSVKPFILALEAFYNQTRNASSVSMPLTENLLDLARRMNILESKSTIESSSADPSTLKKAVDKVTDKFKGFEQRDAHEFTATFIDLLHDEVSAAVGADDVAPTDRFCLVTVQVCLTCDVCGYSRSKEEKYRHLSLDIGEVRPGSEHFSIKDGLKQFFSTVKVEVKCEKCTEGMVATQSMKMMNRPKALFLHLKRFTVSYVMENETSGTIHDSAASSRKRSSDIIPSILKNKAKLSLDKELSVDLFKESDTYRLQSVVHHLGLTASSGHYTADSVRASIDGGEQWVRFDDGVTRETSLSAIVENEKTRGDAYMLMYVM